jgi:ketosteroid isomerase-like protein
MSFAVDTRDAEEELRQIVADRVAAICSKDSAALAESQAEDVITFDVLPPLRTRGRAEEAAKIRAWFDGYAGDIGFEVQDLHVAADGDVGFCSFVYHVRGTLTTGGQVDRRCAQPSVSGASAGAGSSCTTTSRFPSTPPPAEL